MSGSLQAVYQNLRSFTPPLPAIGDAYGGGYFAGQINDGGTVYNLVLSDKTVGQFYNKTWGPLATTTGATSLSNGKTNTATLVALGASYQCATLCAAINSGGYTDWYMPSYYELEILYYFFKPDTTSNNTSAGSNPNAVSPEPISTNYTAGNPAQTPLTNFQTGGAQELNGPFLWTSSEFSSNNAYFRQTSDGGQGNYAKNRTGTITRAIRRVAA
jgi:hypothetical protein